MPTQQGVARMLRQHREEGKTFLSMDDIFDYISPNRLDPELRQKGHVLDDPEFLSALEEVDSFLYNLGCKRTDNGYTIPVRETAH